MFDNAETTPFKARIEENVRIPTTQRGLSPRLQDCDLFQDNEVNDNGDFVHFALMVEFEHVNMEDALSDSKWICAMKEELESIEKNKTWEFIDLLYRKKPIGVRWVFKVKENPMGEIIKHKAKLVAKRFLQREVIDFEEVFTSVTRIETIRLVVDIVNNNNWSIYQMDVKYAFLNRPLEEKVYVEQPPDFVVRNQESKFYKLKRMLYGLK